MTYGNRFMPQRIINKLGRQKYRFVAEGIIEAR